MTHTDQAIENFFFNLAANQKTWQATALAKSIVQSIQELKSKEDFDVDFDYDNAFSVDGFYEDGEFSSEVAFEEDYRLTVMYQKNTDNETVNNIFELNEAGLKEIHRLAALMLTESWVKGYSE